MIHADNYRKILNSLGSRLESPQSAMLVSDTQTNLRKAAEKELTKINETYPDFLKKLERESHDARFLSIHIHQQGGLKCRFVEID